MKFQIFMLVLFAFFLMGCQGSSTDPSVPAQTSEEFGIQVLSCLQQKDATTFEGLLLTKREARKIFRKRNGRISFNEFWTRVESDQANLFSNVLNSADFSEAELDSIRKNPSLAKGMDPLFMLNR